MDSNRRRTEDRRLKLDIIQCYGSLCSQKLKDCISIIDDDNRRLVFPVGKFIAQKCLEKTDMQFIKLSDNMDSIACMTKSPNKRLLAVSERLKNDSLPQVAIYNLRAAPSKIEQEKRVFKYSESKSTYFSAVAFSHQDSRFMVCLTGEPDFQIIFLDIARMKPLAHAVLGTDISRISISPKDNHMVAVSGRNCFKILRVQENSFISLAESIKRLAPNQNFTDHVWFDESKIVLANDKGEIFIIQDQDVRQYINSAFNDLVGLGITSIIAFSKGFIAGSESGHMAIWIKAEDGDKGYNNVNYIIRDDLLNDELSFLKRWHTERKSGISAIDINTNEELIAVAFHNNDIATIEMSQVLPNSTTEVLESFKNNSKFLNREVKFDFLFNGFHNGPVTGIDVCLQRPLIVTCSKYDATIRIWNYVNQRCELARKFYIGEDGNQQPLGSKDSQQIVQTPDISPLVSVAFHPSGYYLAAGFIDKLRIFHVLHSELRVYREIPIKNATQLKFSSGGHMLAAAYPRAKSNHYQINVYDSFTLELINTLKGHTHQVTDILWGPKDSFVATCGIDGGIYEWNTIDWGRKDFTLQNNKYHSMIYDTPINMLLAAGTETIKDTHKSTTDKDFNNKEERSIVRELRTNISAGMTNTNHSQSHIHDLGNQKINQICFIQSLYNQCGIIGGTDQGQVKIFSYIFNHISFETMSVHQGEITKIRCSPDGRFVFTCGADGSVFVFQVCEISQEGQIFSAKQGGEALEAIEDVQKLNPRAMVIDENLADVVLVARSEIETYIAEQRKLQNDLQDLDYKTDFKVQDERRRMEKEKKEMEIKMNHEISAWARRYEELKTQKSTVEKESTNLFKNVENNHLKAVEELENLYERKLAFENEKYLQLEQVLMEERMRFQTVMKGLERKHDSNIGMLKDEFSVNFMKAERVYESTKATADDLRTIYEEKLAQQEGEYEYEIQEINVKHKKDLEELKNKLAAAMTEMELYKRENKQANEDRERAIEGDQEKQQEIETQERKLGEAHIRQLIQQKQKRIEVQQEELKERDEQLKKKEKKIYEYKYKINDLQKSKHVLSFRTTEMRKSLEPKEAQIDKLKEELFKLESEFEAMLKSSQVQNDKMKKMQNQIDTLTKNLKQQCETTALKENILHKLTMEIHNCVNFKDDKLWKNEMKNIYQTYVLNQEIKQIQHDPKGIEEMSRQIVHLEKGIFQMNNSSEKIILRREKEIYKKTKENAELIYDLNDMRKQNKEFTTELSNKTILLENMRNEVTKLKQEAQRMKQQGFKGTEGLKQESQFDEYVSPNSQNGMQSSNILPPARMGMSAQNRQTSMPQRGKIIKGTNFDQKTLSTFDKAKMMDLLAEMELSTQKIIIQDSIIKSMRNKIMRHIQEKGCNDDAFEEDINSIIDQDDGMQRPYSQKFNTKQ